MTPAELTLQLQLFQMGYPFYREKANGCGAVFHKFHEGRVYTGSLDKTFSPDNFEWVNGESMCQYILTSIRLGRIKPFDYKDKVFDDCFTDDIEAALMVVPTSPDTSDSLGRELKEAKDALAKHKRDLEEERKAVSKKMEQMRQEFRDKERMFRNTSGRTKEEQEERDREFFHKGWRKAEEKYKQEASQNDSGERLTDREWLAKTLMVDVLERDLCVWQKARKQYMLAHHPDRNKWADPKVVAKVNAIFDKVFK